ncbi:MAG: NYN domain-containing protein [Maioricimonas sp. JB045]
MPSFTQFGETPVPMARDLLIDGYNLMHAVGLARRRYGPGDLERSRDRLLKWLSRNLRDSERLRTTVVFDAKDAPVAGNLDLHFRDMTIRFAGKEAEADDLIEALIEYHSAPKRLIVVSGDRRLQRAARRRRAIAIDSERFHAELMLRAEDIDQGPRQPDPKRDAAISDSEMAAWLATFEDVHPDEIQREVDRERPRTKPTPSTPPAAPRPAGSSSTSAKSSGKPSGPKPGSPGPGRSPQKRSAPARRNGRPGEDREKAVPDPPAGDEIDFWEQRIAELLDDDRPAT